MRWLDVNEEINNVAPTNLSGPGCYMGTRNGNHDWPHKIRLLSLLGLALMTSQ
jgi:hypothetical protein